MHARTDVLNLVDRHLRQPLMSFDPATPIEEAVFDSFGFVELALGLEEEFGLRLSEAETADFATIGDLRAAIEAGLDARSLH